MKLNEIFEGWKNTVIIDRKIEMLSMERMLTCNDCKFKTEMLGIDSCGICHCPLIAKTRSPASSCPKGFWKAKDK